jgi:hypothetical protein
MVFFIFLHDRESSLHLRSCGGESLFEACSSGFADQRRQKYRYTRGRYKPMHFVDLRVQSLYQWLYSAYMIFHCCIEPRLSSHASNAFILICKCHAVEGETPLGVHTYSKFEEILEPMSDPTRCLTFAKSWRESHTVSSQYCYHLNSIFISVSVSF